MFVFYMVFGMEEEWIVSGVVFILVIGMLCSEVGC